MQQVADLHPNDDTESWINVLNEFITLHEDASSFIPKYGDANTKTRCVFKLMEKVNEALEITEFDDTVLAACLHVIRILMRERTAIDELLTIQALNTFFKIAQVAQVKEAAACEALKCAINSIYDRPDFVNEFTSKNGFDQVVLMLKLPRSASFHHLVCKCLVFGCGESTKLIHELKGNLHIISFMVPTLAYALRHEPPVFPKGKSRASLVQEILKLIFALGTEGNHLPANEENTELMTQLGILLCEMLFLPNRPEEVFEVKALVINTLMYMPDYYSNYLVANQALKPLVNFLALQLDMVLLEKSRLTNQVSPTVIVLNKLASSNVMAKQIINEIIFPPEDEDRLKKKRDDKRQHFIQKANEAESEEERLSVMNEIRDQAMHPEDNPKDSLKGKLLRFMTSLDPLMKRHTSEFIFTLCDNDAKEFTRRCGMGNAVALLKTKGIM